MSKPLSAVDCVSPSFEWTKRQLFVPFRFRRWLRLAVVCLVLGDFAGGGGYTGNLGLPGLPDRSNPPQSSTAFLDWSQYQPFMPLLIGGAVLLFALVVLWLYVSSVYRFVLFDSVLYDRCELKGVWRSGSLPAAATSAGLSHCSSAWWPSRCCWAEERLSSPGAWEFSETRETTLPRWSWVASHCYALCLGSS